MRIIQISDVHIWKYVWNPFRLWGKRSVGMASLVTGRARRFRLERLKSVVDRIVDLEPDYLLITGDLTTTALPDEFRNARAALMPLLGRTDKVAAIPGNHDRYTGNSVRTRQFETYFGEFTGGPFPWLRRVDDRTSILGLDPTRSHLSATGKMPEDQLERARALIEDPATRPERLIVMCHYPVEAPTRYADDLHHKRIVNAGPLVAWLKTIGPHVFCCGHVHAAWAFRPEAIPNQLCLNSGAPLLRDPTGLQPPGFLQMELDGDGIEVLHHAWAEDAWKVESFVRESGTFLRGQNLTTPSRSA